EIGQELKRRANVRKSVLVFRSGKDVQVDTSVLSSRKRRLPELAAVAVAPNPSYLSIILESLSEHLQGRNPTHVLLRQIVVWLGPKTIFGNLRPARRNDFVRKLLQ